MNGGRKQRGRMAAWAQLGLAALLLALICLAFVNESARRLITGAMHAHTAPLGGGD